MYELSNSQLNLPIDVVKKQVHVVRDPIEACKDSHAVVILTEWDEFKVISVCFFILLNTKFFKFLQEYDYQKIYDAMLKPASIFDGRLILDHAKLRQIGFHVEAIGKASKQKIQAIQTP